MKGFLTYLDLMQAYKPKETNYYEAGFNFIDDEAWKSMEKYKNTLKNF